MSPQEPGFSSVQDLSLPSRVYYQPTQRSIQWKGRLGPQSYSPAWHPLPLLPCPRSRPPRFRLRYGPRVTPGTKLCTGLLHTFCAQLPSQLPTQMPSPGPISAPTMLPTDPPADLPTVSPTNEPSARPTMAPTVWPTQHPSLLPTAMPTGLPSTTPTLRPSMLPTQSPTPSPTQAPTPLPLSLVILSPAHQRNGSQYFNVQDEVQLYADSPVSSSAEHNWTATPSLPLGCMVPVGPYLTVRGGCYHSGTTYIFRLDVIINGAAEASRQVRPRV
jgi:hypothetical protein